MRHPLVTALLVLLFSMIAGLGVAAQSTMAASRPAGSSGSGDSVATPDYAAFGRLYRDVVLAHMAQGETVEVPLDMMGYLTGSVRVVRAHRTSQIGTAALAASGLSMQGGDLKTQVLALADQLSDSDSKEALRQFAASATAEQLTSFYLFGTTVRGKDATFRITGSTSDEKCHESCQTVCHVACHEVCKMDCRIVNGEKVCEESCKTICPEVCNMVCHQVCK